MFAALYGELTPHAWRDPELEAHSLFYHRSLAMGWLDDRSAGGGQEDRMVRAPGLWATNDAGWTRPSAAAGEDLIAWFQVEASRVPDDRPLPVQPFLRCAEDVTARAGTVDLSAVQLLLPVHGLRPASRPPYLYVPALQTIPWLSACDPRSRTSVVVNISSGREKSVPAIAKQLIEQVGRFGQDVFVCGSRYVVGRSDVRPPPFDDIAWNGPLHGVILRGELVEWSCEAMGWLAEVIADSVAQAGVRTPVLLTFERDISA